MDHTVLLKLNPNLFPLCEMDHSITLWCIILVAVRGDTQKHLSCLSRAAESIAVGDTVDAVVRRAQKWNMLPTQVSLSFLLFYQLH